MSYLVKYSILLLIIIFSFFGCATVEETLYLRDAEVFGPVNPSPIYITDSIVTPSVTISPTFSYSTQNTFTGDVKEFTTLYGLDTTYIPPENSLVWDVSTFNAGVNIDLALLKGFAIALGLNYSGQKNYDLWGGHIGIGFFTYSNGIGFRTDLGIQIQSMSYDAYTVSEVLVDEFFGGTERYISFYHDIGESTHYDPYITLTFNTAYKSWPVNIFINGGYVVQTLFSFDPQTSYYYYPTYRQTDKRGSSTAGFVALTPGVYFNITEVTRVLAGCSFYIETQISEANPSLFIIPMMQVDFTL